MRLDVRENLEQAAAAELEHNGSYVFLVAEPLVDELAEWSRPVRLRAVKAEGSAIVEMEVSVEMEDVSAFSPVE